MTLIEVVADLLYEKYSRSEWEWRQQSKGVKDEWRGDARQIISFIRTKSKVIVK